MCNIQIVCNAVRANFERKIIILLTEKELAYIKPSGLIYRGGK